MTIQELDREFLVERCSILNAYLEGDTDLEETMEELDRLDFKFETLVDIERLNATEKPKPYDWSKR